MQKKCIKFRLSEDSDYGKATEKNAPNSKEQFENLKKL